MRPSLSCLAIAGALLCAGCAHVATESPSAETNAAATALLSEHASHNRLLHIYVDGGDEQGAALFAGQTHAGTVAQSLRDQLRQRGYDVRGTETALPRGDVGVGPGALARAIADGQFPPASSRAVTYLHPNAPRLVLFVHLREEPTLTGRTETGPAVVLGAFIADSADGTILWSNRVSAPLPATDSQLRLLADLLLKTLPQAPTPAA